MNLDSRIRNALTLVVGGTTFVTCSWLLLDDYPRTMPTLVWGVGMLMIGAAWYINGGTIYRLKKEIARLQKHDELELDDNSEG